MSAVIDHDKNIINSRNRTGPSKRYKVSLHKDAPICVEGEVNILTSVFNLHIDKALDAVYMAKRLGAIVILREMSWDVAETMVAKANEERERYQKNEPYMDTVNFVIE